MIISRRSFLKGAAAVVAAPAIIKASHLMNVWTPPEPEIFTGYGTPDIITDIDAVGTQFTVSGLLPNTIVTLFDGVTGRKIGGSFSRGSEALFLLTGARQRKIEIVAQHAMAKLVRAKLEIPFGVELHNFHFEKLATEGQPVFRDTRIKGWSGRSA